MFRAYSGAGWQENGEKRGEAARRAQHQQVAGERLRRPPMGRRARRAGQFHVETSMIYKLGLNHNYYTFTWILLIEIVMCSQINWIKVYKFQVFRYEIQGLYADHKWVDAPAVQANLICRERIWYAEKIQLQPFWQWSLLHSMFFTSDIKTNVL